MLNESAQRHLGEQHHVTAERHHRPKHEPANFVRAFAALISASRSNRSYISHNLVTEIQADLFANTEQLATLYMSGNLFTALPSGVFHGLSALTTLFVLYGMIAV